MNKEDCIFYYRTVKLSPWHFGAPVYKNGDVIDIILIMLRKWIC